jgi:molybdopterin synthase catalytic subunit
MVKAVSVEVEVQYFAAARELCGCASERIALAQGPLDVRAFLALLGARHARLAPLIGRMRLARNGEIVADDALIGGGDQVGVLPPLAGGSGAPNAPGVMLSAIREQPLSVDEVLAAVSAAHAGGIALFVGSVRDHADGQSVARLDYEAHPLMAERELAAVLAEIAAGDPELRLAAVHRVGKLQVGDLAVVVAASAPHRAEAFAACRAAIERIKERVPIWKKEWSPEGEAHWVNLEG